MQRTDPTTPTTAKNLYVACFDSAQKLLATLPGIRPIDLAVAYTAVGLALLSDLKVVDHETGRQILVDTLAQFDAGAGDPGETSH